MIKDPQVTKIEVLDPTATRFVTVPKASFVAAVKKAVTEEYKEANYVDLLSFFPRYNWTVANQVKKAGSGVF